MTSTSSARNFFTRTRTISRSERSAAQIYAERIRLTRLGYTEADLYANELPLEALNDSRDEVLCCDRPLSPSGAIDQVIEVLKTLKQMPSRCFNRLVEGGLNNGEGGDSEPNVGQTEPQPQFDQDIQCAKTLSSLRCIDNRTTQKSTGSNLELDKELPPVPRDSLLSQDPALSVSSDIGHRRGAIDRGSPIDNVAQEFDTRSWSSSWYNAQNTSSPPAGTGENED